MQSPDEDDYKKLGWCLHYLCNSWSLSLMLEADMMSHICWWINTLFAMHHDYKSHTGATMLFRKGSVSLLSTKQKITHTVQWKLELTTPCHWFYGFSRSFKLKDSMSLTMLSAKTIKAPCFLPTMGINPVVRKHTTSRYGIISSPIVFAAGLLAWGIVRPRT